MEVVLRYSVLWVRRRDGVESVCMCVVLSGSVPWGVCLAVVDAMALVVSLHARIC